jgi:hypothetical protein
MLDRGQSAGRRLLVPLGIAAGPLYILVGLLQVATRDGFDVRRHAISHLANGEYGWIQVANFLVCGALVVAGALGCRQLLRGQRGGTWGPLLLATYGLGLIGAGLFRADPAPGFPPGVEVPAELTTSGLLHFAFGGVGFYALIAACFVLARHFAVTDRKGLARFSVLTGAGFFLSFAAVASGSTSPVVMIAFYVAVAWVWAWHTLALRQVARSSSPPGDEIR